MKDDRERTDQLENVVVRSSSVGSIPEPTVYSGTMMENLGEGVESTGRNRKSTRRTFSTFNLMLMLLGSAVIIVLYISNVIKVSQLLAEIDKLEAQHRRMTMEQELLHAQVNRMSSLERVRKLSEEQLGLRNPTEPPVWIKVDEEKIRAVEQAANRPRKR